MTFREVCNMKISIQCFGQLRTITKERYVELEVEEKTSIFKAIEQLKNKYGKSVERLLYNDGQIREFFFIQVDNSNIEHDELDEIFVEEGQIISIIPFVAGG